jgi:hypothetical protein
VSYGSSSVGSPTPLGDPLNRHPQRFGQPQEGGQVREAPVVFPPAQGTGGDAGAAGGLGAGRAGGCPPGEKVLAEAQGLTAVIGVASQTRNPSSPPLTRR